MKRSPARAICASVLGCPQAASQTSSPAEPASCCRRSKEAPISATSAALPGSGRTYSETPSAVVACSART
jgi:hypothetical protein